MCLSSLASVHLGLRAALHTLSVFRKLLRQIYIEKPFAYQTAGMQRSHHLSLIYREMHVALTRRSACPLYLRLPFVGTS